MGLEGWNSVGDYWPPAALPGASATLATNQFLKPVDCENGTSPAPLLQPLAKRSVHA